MTSGRDVAPGAVSRWQRSVLATVFLGLLAGAVFFYRAQEQLLRHEVEANLLSIANLKVGQIAKWR